MKCAFFIQNWAVAPILLFGMAVFIAISWSYPQVTEGKHDRAELAAIQPLTPPSGFTAADEDSDTAFREGEAGFAAWVRIAASDQGDNEPRLDVLGIKERLEAEPDPNKSGTADGIRGAGANVDWGLNFAIVELPMYSAVISPKPIENVTVYFDDQGWVVAYLPKDRPAAAIWKYKSVGDSRGNEELENNLLVVAIKEVLKAGDIDTSEIIDDEGKYTVKYYDWDNEDCDAFALFSAVASGESSAPVKFVIPRTITDIQASAAVVIAEQAQGGDSTTASIDVDEEIVAEANADQLRNAVEFELDRETDDDGSPKTSLHKMMVDVGAENVAAGVVMLVYDKP